MRVHPLLSRRAQSAQAFHPATLAFDLPVYPFHIHTEPKELDLFLDGHGCPLCGRDVLLVRLVDKEARRYHVPHRDQNLRILTRW